MSTFYLGRTTDGRIVSRKSTNPNFTHAAMATGERRSGLPNFSTSADRARALFVQNWREAPAFEVVELSKVDGPAYRAATKGINPKTGFAA